MSQTSLWQPNSQNNEFAEICNALYERELQVLAKGDFNSILSLQSRLKSLSYYIKRTAALMSKVNEQGRTPLTLDIQNASWSAKQSAKLSLAGQSTKEVSKWYLTQKLTLGLVIPILQGNHVILDSIDRVDLDNQRLRTNYSGWFLLSDENDDANFEVGKGKHVHSPSINKTQLKILKPNKKVMLAACAGHCWQHTENNSFNSARLLPSLLSLRELLLSCAINWKDFKQPLAL